MNKSLFPSAVSLVGALAISLTFLTASCDKKEEPDPKIAACKDQKPVTAAFKIQENINGTLVESDTVMNNNPIVFTASEKYDSYEWRVGGDPRSFTTKSFPLTFTYAAGKIDVTLIARKKPNTLCFPKDDGIDTLTRSFHVIHRNSLKAPILGKYEGHNLDNPSDRFVVTIDMYTPEPEYPDMIDYRILNLNKGCNFNGITVYRGGRGIWFNADFSGNGCKDPRGVAALDSTNRNKIRIEYSVFEGTFPNRANKVFIGTRVYQ